MASIYIVDTSPQDGDDPEVHTQWCNRLPLIKEQIVLGHFENCHDAIMRARVLDIFATGCYYCCRECH